MQPNSKSARQQLTTLSALAAVSLAFATIGVRAAEPVIISEFLASNAGGLRDEDGASSDWIELFNSSSNIVNLNGWFLTDDAGRLTKWRFPSTNLPPNGFLVVFASGKDRAVPGRPLHANFSLSASGEYLALVHSNGVTIASQFAPRFPEQYPNVSYGPGQDLQVTRFIGDRAAARVFIPTNAAPGVTWTTPDFNDTGWRAGTNGVGYETYVAGFAVRNVRANVSVCDLSTALTVLAEPARQAAVFAANPGVINYVNTGDDAHFPNGATFPGFTIGVDEESFVTEATGIVTIPASGYWTFGVSSDDGFRVELGTNVFEYPPPRGPADTLAAFNLPAGDYPVRLVFYECGGGSEVEFFAAPGALGGFDGSFRLVGDTGSGGLAVKSLPVGGASGTSLRPLIVTDVQAQMLGKSGSAYVRLPFAVEDPSVFTTLTLRMKYDDGFVAYLNGIEIARRNAPASPQWNSVATTAHSVASAIVFEDMDVTSQLGLLRAGTNALAIHGLNVSTSDGDFLALAELVQNKVVGTTNHYFATPTPGTFNSAQFAALVSELKVSPNRGWFENTNLSVTVTSATPGISIRYTTNGSAPTATTGTFYTGPIHLRSTTVLRAVGFREGFEPSPVETHSYLFLDQVQQQNTNQNYVGGSAGDYTLNPTVTQQPPYRDTFKSDLLSLPTLSVSAAWEDLFGPAGIWSNTQGQGAAWERPCSLEYLRPDGQKGFHVNCGIRIQGGASRGMVPKHGLRVLFKRQYGPGELAYNLYPDSPVKAFDTLTLHAMFNDHWGWGAAQAAMHRDQWCRDTQNAMAGYGPHGTYVHLYLNGLYWGLYNVGEKGDASYAAHYLGGDKTEYDALNSDELIDGNADAWNTLFNFVDVGAINDLAYTNLAQYLNIPNFIDYLLLNFYAANMDWPGHNWNAARRRVPGAGFHFFSWDAEWTFGIGSNLGTDRTGIGAGDGSVGRIYAALRVHPEFRREFGDHAQRRLFNHGALTPAAAGARWQQRSDEIDRAVVGEAARWGNGYTRETWLAADAAVRAWFPQRAAILINQLRSAGLFPQLNAPEFSPFGGLVTPGFALMLTNSNPSGAIYFTLDGSDPRAWGGGLAASANLFATPLVLTNAVFVRARVRDGANWSALVEATFYPVQDFSRLALTELMYHPPDAGPTDGDEFEFLELKNTGITPLDLSGLNFTAGVTFAFTNGSRLAPGGFLVLARNAAAFAAKYPGVALSGIYSGKLDNAGEGLTLAHVLGTNVFSFSFANNPPWPITPDGHGFSLVRANLAGDPGSAASWRASANVGGSPGADDPAPVIPRILINEVLAHTDPPQQDAIELHNAAATTANVGGWFLSDDAATPRKYRIPNGTAIPAGGYLQFTATDFNPAPGVLPSFALSSWGESLYLFSGDAATNLTGYSHSLTYGPSANGVSFGRLVISTGEECWPAQAALSVGTNNVGPRLGPVVINEIQYHPAAGYDEFVELHNLSATNVPLYDPAFPTNGWKLNGLGFTFSSNITMPSGSFLLLVAIAPEVFRAKYSVPASVPILGAYAGSLQNGGERLALERPDPPDTNGLASIVVDEVRYRDQAPWPLSADGAGPSLQRRAPTAYGNEPTNWFASGITPGATNVLNQPPICTLITPTNGANFAAPAHVTFSATASDSDGFIRRVEFYADEVTLGEATNAPFTFVWSNAPAGTHTLVAKARDNGLAVTPSAPVSIRVTPPPMGSGTGLRGDYYDNLNFTGTRVRRMDPTVNFDWGGGAPAAGIGEDTFSVRWTGKVQPRYSETYTFYTVSDDGIRLWVNDQLLIDNWTDHGPTENAGLLALQAGQLYDVKLEMYENGGGAVAQLFWSAPSVLQEVIPATQLYPPATTNQPPSVILTNPPTGAAFVAGSTVEVAASASDPDGAVARVEFYFDARLLGTATVSPFSLLWLNLPVGPHRLTAVVTDDGGLSRTSAPVDIAVVAGFTTNVTLIATGAVWKYRDTGADLGATWTAIHYNDSAWAVGPAMLGYGDANGEWPTTTVAFGPDANNKYITTYFRRAFVLSNPASFTALDLRVQRDDGVLIHLNGMPVYRNNLPGDPINYLTAALANVSGVDETSFYSSAIDPGYLVPGTNVIAAEVHQSSAMSSDFAFDFELIGRADFRAPYLAAQPQSQAAFAGSNATFNATAVGTAPLDYQWRFNGTALAGETKATLTLPNVQTNQAGSYLLAVTNLAGAATSSVAFLTVSFLDSDGDGMPDFWEVAHGLNPQANDAVFDADHDGLNNLQEYLAGTDPHDPQSVFRLAISGDSDAAWRLQFSAVSNHSYTVQTATNLSSGTWEKLLDVPVAATNRDISIPFFPDGTAERGFRLVTPAR